jgi:hypothetical protein
MMASICCTVVAAYWKHGFPSRVRSQDFSVRLERLWLGTEIATFLLSAAGDWIRTQWPVFLVFGLVLAFFQNLPKVKCSCRLSGRDVTLEIRGRQHLQVAGAFVIGSNTSFDTDLAKELISAKSVQGQFYKDVLRQQRATSRCRYRGGFERCRSAGDIEHEGREVPDIPVGTVAHVVRKGVGLTLLAWPPMNDHGLLAERLTT